MVKCQPLRSRDTPSRNSMSRQSESTPSCENTALGYMLHKLTLKSFTAGTSIQFDNRQRSVRHTPMTPLGILSREKPKFTCPSMQSRRYMLEQNQVDPPLAPRNAEMVSLDPDQQAEQATYDILLECLQQIAANVAVVKDLADPEGPHQLRI